MGGLHSKTKTKTKNYRVKGSSPNSKKDVEIVVHGSHTGRTPTATVKDSSYWRPAAGVSPSRMTSEQRSKITVDDFELLKVVGKGSFGKVMMVKYKHTGKIYAMKVLKKKQLALRKQIAHTKTERQILQQIDHPFIVSLRFAFQTKEKLYMVLDFFNGGELFYHLKKDKRFTQRRARFYAAQILLALEHLHQNNIVYRDLKPENLLLDSDGNVRLTDFGLSKQFSNMDLTHTFCGTPEYLAPEVLEQKGHGKAVDWWSLGTFIYEMLTGLPPFYNQNTQIMYEQILRGKLKFPGYLSAEAKDILSKLLERNPAKRLGSHEDAEDLKKHPFFRGMDWDKLYRKELTPPFKPNVSDGGDTSNIDADFTRETPRDSPVLGSKLGAVNSGGTLSFENFTYVPNEELGQIRNSISVSGGNRTFRS